MAENKRIAIPKKIRFEVFKRDSFKCQYCGASAPDVTLEVDHIQPVAEGGGNDIFNLITSCRDCNRGKSKTLLTDNETISRQKRQLDLMQERREQLEMMSEWRKELLEEIDVQINSINDLVNSMSLIWQTIRIQNGDFFRKLINQFGYDEVYISTDIAFQKYRDTDTALHMIGGICFNRKRNKEIEDKYHGNL